MTRRKHDQPLTVEELDEFERHCEAFVEDDPNDQFGVVALRVLEENRELRHLLRTMDKTDAQKTVIQQVDKIERLQGKVFDLERDKTELGDKVKERDQKIEAMEAELERTRALLTDIATATGAALGAAVVPPPPPPAAMIAADAEAAIRGYSDRMASEVGLSNDPRFANEKPTVADMHIARAVPSSKKRQQLPGCIRHKGNPQSSCVACLAQPEKTEES